MHVDTQFSIFLINKPGVLASVTGALGKAHVNMLALTLMDTGEHGVLRIITDDANATRTVLGSAHDRWTETDVLVLEMDNKPGTFADTAQKLADAHVNITYAYCSSGAGGGRTTAVFKITISRRLRKCSRRQCGPKRMHPMFAGRRRGDSGAWFQVAQAFQAVRTGWKACATRITAPGHHLASAVFHGGCCWASL